MKKTAQNSAEDKLRRGRRKWARFYNSLTWQGRKLYTGTETFPATAISGINKIGINIFQKTIGKYDKNRAKTRGFRITGTPLRFTNFYNLF